MFNTMCKDHTNISCCTEHVLTGTTIDSLNNLDASTFHFDATMFSQSKNQSPGDLTQFVRRSLNNQLSTC